MKELTPAAHVDMELVPLTPPTVCPKVFVHKLKSDEPVGVALLLQLAGRRLNVRTSAKLQECYSEVTQEDDERKSIVQQILHRSRDFLRRIIVPVQG